MRVLFVPVLAVCLCGLPAMAGSVLFSDLGTSAYIAYSGWTICGSGCPLGASVAEAMPFTVAGSGSLPVQQISMPLVTRRITSIPFTPVFGPTTPACRESRSPVLTGASQHLQPLEPAAAWLASPE